MTVMTARAPTTRASTGLVSEVVLATGRLVAALEAEVEALRRGEIASLESTRAEKARLIRNYEAKLQALKSQPTLRASVEPALKDALEEATLKLQRAIDRNVSQLRAAAEANRRLVDAIARAAVEAAQRPGYGPGYGQRHGSGRLHPAIAAGRSAPAAAVSVSRQL